MKIFQFLIVRLKEPAAKWYCDYADISIPYSTIKSCEACKHSPLRCISIPYSTIKRQPRFRSSSISWRFQFLIVRLKALTVLGFVVSMRISIPYSTIKSLLVGRSSRTASVISIPYSTIKRVRRRFADAPEDKFQFLIVRLKDPYVSPTWLLQGNFNSLQYD